MELKRILVIAAIGIMVIVLVVVVRVLFLAQAEDFEATIGRQNAIIEDQLRLNAEMLSTLDKLQGGLYNIHELVAAQKAGITKYEKTREVIHDTVAARPVSELQPLLQSGIERFRRERDAVQRGGQPDAAGDGGTVLPPKGTDR